MRILCGIILAVVVSAMSTANAETKFLDESARAEVARRAAAESIVLLKNENATLPLPANAAVTVAQPWPWVFSGGGSGFVLPKHAVDVAEGLLESGFDVVSNANCAVLVVSRFCREGVDSPPEDARLNEDETAALDRFKRSGAKVEKTKDGYEFTAGIPRKFLGENGKPAQGETGSADVVVLFGDAGGATTVRRAYLFDQESQVVSDLPSEVRVNPSNWGTMAF